MTDCLRLCRISQWDLEDNCFLKINTSQGGSLVAVCLHSGDNIFNRSFWNTTDKLFLIKYGKSKQSENSQRTDIDSRPKVKSFVVSSEDVFVTCQVARSSTIVTHDIIINLPDWFEYLKKIQWKHPQVKPLWEGRGKPGFFFPGSEDLRLRTSYFVDKGNVSSYLPGQPLLHSSRIKGLHGLGQECKGTVQKPQWQVIKYGNSSVYKDMSF